MKREPEKRFWKKVYPTGNGCWEWLGERTKHNYGRFYMQGRRDSMPAHRYAWMSANGREIPDGLWVLHSCDNPPCVNPAHLRLGTNVDNVRDKVERGRLPDQRGSRNPIAILSDSDVIDIRTLRAMGARGTDLAAAFGMSEQGICNIVKRRSWEHVP